MSKEIRREIGIDEKLSVGGSLFYGVQSVIALNLFLGAIIISGALGMDIKNTAIMVTCSFLASGLATFVQAGFFMKYPVVQGVSFATIGAIVAITFSHDLATAFGSLILGSIIIILLGAFKLFSKILRFIPPIVAGTVVLVIGLSVMFTACTSLITLPGNPGSNFTLGAIVFVLIFVFMVISNSNIPVITKFISRGSVLWAIIITTIIASFMGVTDFSAVASAPWIGLPPVMAFGLPKFDLISSLVFLFIYFIVLVETVGNWFAISFTIKDTLTDDRINKGVLGEGVGCLIGALVGTAPVTSYAPNCGVLTLTKVYSRWAAVGAGIIIVVLSFFPKLMFVIASIPAPIMLGTLCAMTIVIMMSGLRSIRHIELTDRNILIIGIPIFVTVIVSLLPPDIVHSMPLLLSYLFSSSLSVGALVAVIVNLLIPKPKETAVEGPNESDQLESAATS